MNRLPVLVVMSLAHFLVMVDATIVNVALPSIRSGLGFTATGLPWVVNSYSFAFGGCLLLGGLVAGRLGPKRVFVGGMAVFGTGSVVCGLAPATEVLVAGRMLQGVGGALVCPAALAAITVTFDSPGERARALAGWSAAGAGALAVGPLVGGALTATWSWPAVFLVPVPLCAGAAVAAWRWLPDRLPDRRTGRRERGFGPAFPYRRVLTANLVLALGSAAMVAACYTCTLWLQTVLGYGPMATGLAFLPLSLGILLGAALAPRLMRRVAATAVAVAGLAVATLGMVLLACLPMAVTPAQLLPALTVLAVGFGLQSVPVCALATTVPGDRALAAAVYQTAGQLGGGLGLVGLGWLAGRVSDVDSVGLAWRSWALAGGAVALAAGVAAVLVSRAHSAHGASVVSQTRE
ncbi:MFS transporter [Actinophytocola sp.]|uniref:MFS transporter n=1 Tax=Actinophytocola sp. TaxID=1872138 RepID=UPI002EDA2A9F